MSASKRRGVHARKRLVIIGNGIAAGRLLDELLSRNALHAFEICVFGEEPGGCYNRVLLSRVLAGGAPRDIVLKDVDWYTGNGIRFHSGRQVLRIDLDEKRVFGGGGIVEHFDELVMATGSRAVTPSITGLHSNAEMLEGAFVFRTLDDCAAIRRNVVPGGNAIVLGGGLLGLEAAKGLADLGMKVTVLERNGGPMARQLDTDGQRVLAERLERQGIFCRGGVAVAAVAGSRRVEALHLTNGERLPCSSLIMACGIQPRVELARSAGLKVGKAMLVNEWLTVEGYPAIHGLGECVEIRGELFGTVAPIFSQAEILADMLIGNVRKVGYRSVTSYTKLKAAGIEVASFGETRQTEGMEVVTASVDTKGIHVRLRIRGERLVGAQLVGDTRLAARLLQYHDQGIPVPEHRLNLLASDVAEQDAVGSPEVCNCHHVTEATILAALDAGAKDLAEISKATRAGTGCGSCRSTLVRIARTRTPNSEVNAA